MYVSKHQERMIQDLKRRKPAMFARMVWIKPIPETTQEKKAKEAA